MSIEIINRALIKIGEPVISSLQQHPYGSSLGLIYEDARRALLSSHYWRFALKRADLAKLDEDTGSDVYAYSYALPADYLTLKDFGDYYKLPNMGDIIPLADTRYSIEGGRLLCKFDLPINITYVADVTDPKLFTPAFKEALIATVAAEISIRIKNGAELKTLFIQEADRYVTQAVNHNEIVRDIETMPDNSWVACRELFHEDW